MKPFEKHLCDIGDQITVKDQYHFTNVYDEIRTRLLMYMTCISSVFRHMYKGTSLFGSTSNNVRINSANEFDVHIMFRPTYGEYIDVEEDKARPGFVCLKFSNCLDHLENDPNLEYVYDFLYQCTDNYYYLRRNAIQNWMEELFEKAVSANNEIFGYNIEYEKRGLAHTIFAYNKWDDRTLSIDFVPSFIFGEEEWMSISSCPNISSRCDTWMAVPKPTGGDKATRYKAFMICNPNAEHDLLLSKQNMKIVFRLLKSLKKAYKLRRLKSYFITTIFLLEIEDKDNDFWYYPVDFLFIYMLGVLTDYFEDEYLPFFWNRERNLLDILRKNELLEYKNSLIEAYNKLSSYEHQPNIRFGTVAQHFAVLE